MADAAIAYADGCRTPHGNDDRRIDRFCEDVLIKSERTAARPRRILMCRGEQPDGGLRQTMARALAGDEELTVDEVESLGARRLAEIVVNHCYRDEGLFQMVWIALAASAPGDVLVKTLAAEIDAIRVDRRFYGYRESGTLAHELDMIREGSPRSFCPVTRAPLRSCSDV